MLSRTPRSILRAALALAAVLVTSGFAPPEPPSTVAPAPKPSTSPEVVGSWEGALAITPDMRIRIVFHVVEAPDGSLQATMESPDQGARGIPVASATYGHGHLVLEVTAVGGRFEGHLAGPDRVEGNWSQGGASFPLELTRVAEVTRPS